MQYLDQAVSHDPETLEQNIMDKRRVYMQFSFLNFITLFTVKHFFLCTSSATDYMAHLVEVQHERGATGGHTFHTLLSSSLLPHQGQ